MIKIYFSICFIFLSLISKSQQEAYPCTSISSDTDYIIVHTLEDGLKQLDDGEFKESLRFQLVSQILSFIETKTTIRTSNSLRNLRGKKNTDELSNSISSSILNNPLIRVCGEGPNMFVTMSISKSEYSKKIRTYFIRKLKRASNSISDLLKIGNIDDKKIYKEKIDFYKKEMSQITSLIAEVELNSDTERMLDRFDRDLSLLENQYVVWRKNRRSRLNPKNLIEGFKEIVN